MYFVSTQARQELNLRPLTMQARASYSRATGNVVNLLMIVSSHKDLIQLIQTAIVVQKLKTWQAREPPILPQAISKCHAYLELCILPLDQQEMTCEGR